MAKATSHRSLKKRPSGAAIKTRLSAAVVQASPKLMPKPISERQSLDSSQPVGRRSGLRKAIPLRKIKGKKSPGGLVYPRAVFEEVASRATQEAPELLRDKVGHPLPFIGDLSCRLAGFEKDLNGVSANSIVVFEWCFRCKFNGTLIEGTRSVKYRANTVYYKRAVPKPPRSIRAAACVVLASVGPVRVAHRALERGVLHRGPRSLLPAFSRTCSSISALQWISAWRPLCQAPPGHRRAQASGDVASCGARPSSTWKRVVVIAGAAG